MMSNKGLLLMAATLFLSLFLHENNDNNMYDLLLNVEQTISDEPQQAISKLDSISFNKVKGEQNRAMFALLYNETLDKSGQISKV